MTFTVSINGLINVNFLVSLVAWRCSLELLVAPISLPFAAASTLFILLPYKDFVERLQTRLPMARNYPVMNRALALMVACIGLNVAAVGLATGAGAWVVSAWNLKTWRPLLSFGKTLKLLVSGVG